MSKEIRDWARAHGTELDDSRGKPPTWIMFFQRAPAWAGTPQNWWLVRLAMKTRRSGAGCREAPEKQQFR